MDPLAANPSHFKPCLGFYCLQLHAAFLKLVFFFWAGDLWQDEVSWKQIYMDYLENTDKVTSEIWQDRTSYRVENLTSRNDY